MPGRAPVAAVRVLVVSSYPPRHCGIGSYARDQVARLREEGHEVTVLSPPDGAGDLRATFEGGRAFRLAAKEGGRFDLVLVHFQTSLYYRPRAPLSKVRTSLSLWRLAARRPVEILIHEADSPKRWRPDYAVLRQAFGRARGLRFHTAAERAAFQDRYGIEGGEVVPHVVAPAGTVPTRREARRTLGLDPDGVVFVTPGFLQPSKGIERAFPAFEGAGLVALYVVGSVRDRIEANLAYVADLYRRSEDLPRVHFLDRYLDDEEFDRWVAAADWLVLPYRRSWSSGVLARAHAVGTPSIVTDVGGLREQSGERDVVVPNRDEDLIEAIHRASAMAAADSRGTA
jgi:glycosyltransferase involved in cell wall biosynthesis